MGVNIEKDPLTGIAPVRLLFDRSLNKKYDDLQYCNTILPGELRKQKQLDFFPIKHQLGTHRISSDDTVVRDIGMVPIKMLLLSRLNPSR